MHVGKAHHEVVRGGVRTFLIWPKTKKNLMKIPKDDDAEGGWVN